MRLLILAFMASSAYALECEKVSYKVNLKMRQELILEGKGQSEIDDIMDARWSVCYGKCGYVDSNFYNCLPKMPKKKRGQ